MIDAGDIHLADINQEQRRLVLIVSNKRFNVLSGRAIVAPEYVGPQPEIVVPRRVDVGGTTFPVDRLMTVSLDPLLDRTDRASAASMATARQAALQITY